MIFPSSDKLYYLCTVYSSHPRGMVIAYNEACSVAGRLLELDVKTFCPIAHGHSLNQYMTSAPDDHDFWMRLDKFYIDKCDELLVATMDNWEKSRGIGEEIGYAEGIGKRVNYLDIPTLEMFDGKRQATERTT